MNLGQVSKSIALTGMFLVWSPEALQANEPSKIQSVIQKTTKKENDILKQSLFLSATEEKFFMEWLKTNITHEVKYIPREEWSKLHCWFSSIDFVHNIQEPYILLPKPLRIWDIPTVISHNFSYTSRLPENPENWKNTNTLFQSDLECVIEEFCATLPKIQNKTLQKQYQRAIQKYIRVYERLFWTYSHEQVLKHVWVNPIEENQQLQEIKDQELKLIPKIQDYIINLAFEEGANRLFDHLASPYENGTLKELIPIDKILKERSLIEKSWDSAKLHQFEFETVSKITKIINAYKYGPKIWGILESHAWSSSRDILQNKEFICAGKALLTHIILKKLNITHKPYISKEHIALTVTMQNDMMYYCDPTSYTELKSITAIDKVEWHYNQILRLYNASPVLWKEKVYSEDAEFKASILLNFSGWLCTEKRLSEAKIWYNLLLKSEWHEDVAHVWLGNISLALWKTQEAIKEYKKALEVNPNYPKVCTILGEIYFQLKDLQNAKKYYNQWYTDNIFSHNELLHFLEILAATNDNDLELQSDLIGVDDIKSHSRFIEILLHYKKIDLALKHCNKLLEKDTKNTEELSRLKEKILKNKK